MAWARSPALHPNTVAGVDAELVAGAAIEAIAGENLIITGIPRRFARSAKNRPAPFLPRAGATNSPGIGNIRAMKNMSFQATKQSSGAHRILSTTGAVEAV